MPRGRGSPGELSRIRAVSAGTPRRRAAPLPMNATASTRILVIALFAALLAACAAYDGRALVPGVARLADVERVMGAPALRWKAADGSEQLAYPRGPLGYHTFMAHIGAGGRLLRIENVLDAKGFAAIRAGMSEDEVLRVLGPPDAARTQYFAARDELVWDWRYCDDWNMTARFYVLFDNGSRRVRSTMSQEESVVADAVLVYPFCGH